MVILTGGELFTGNVFFMLTGWLSKKVSAKQLAVNWSVSFLGNFLGALFIAYMAFQAGTTATQPWLGATMSVAAFKSSLPLATAITRGILCNWMVCTAIWFATAAQSAAGKFLGIWLLVSSFVAMGFEHSIANMFLIPLGACVYRPRGCSR
jgi:formate/nitrite transporter